MKKLGIKSLLGVVLGTTSLSCFSLTSCNENNIKYPDYSLVCMGDSITYGMPAGGGQMPIPYPRGLANQLSFGHYYNYGICGSSVTNGIGSSDPMVDRVKDMVPNANIIIFMGGVNDYIRGCELGKKGDTSPSTLYGALNSICSTLTQKYADKFVMFMTPLPTTRTPVTFKLTDACEAINYTCLQYNIPVLDLYNQSGFEEEMVKDYSDGLHPTQMFVLNNLVPKIYDFIKNHIG